MPRGKRTEFNPFRRVNKERFISADIEYPGNLSRGVDEEVQLPISELKNAQLLSTGKTHGYNPSYASFRLSDGREAMVDVGDYKPTRKNRKTVHEEGLFIDDKDYNDYIIDYIFGKGF